MTNTRMTDPEVLERRYPVRLERFAVREGCPIHFTGAIPIAVLGLAVMPISSKN